MENSFVRKMIYGISTVLAILSFVACNGNSQTAATAATTTSGYYLSNGTCYASGTATVVATTYCTTTGTTYYLSNGTCYTNGTNAIVATSYCTTTSTTTTTTSICLGTYYDPRYSIWGTCNGTNCHGVSLYKTSGQLVYCP